MPPHTGVKRTHSYLGAPARARGWERSTAGLCHKHSMFNTSADPPLLRYSARRFFSGAVLSIIAPLTLALMSSARAVGVPGAVVTWVTWKTS